MVVAAIHQPRTLTWAWTVAVLALCHAAAVATFQILNILVEPIKASFAVNDTQYSLMQGFAVAIFASLLGIPAARIADRGSRRRIISIGVITWSAATVLCAASQSVWQLFIARMLVGVGEAFFYPAALSLIADVAPSARLSTAIGAFGCGGPLGTALALIGGGWLVSNEAWLAATFAPPMASSWRLGFLACSALGALAAVLLVFTVSEPTQRRTGSALAGGFVATLVHLRQHWRVFAGVSGALLALSFCVFATSSWAPSVLVRVHRMSYTDVASITGVAALVGGALGAWVAGIATDSLETRRRLDASLRVGIAVAILMVATPVVAVTVSASGWAAASICIAYALLGMPTVLGGTALQQISPPAIRAQVMAIQVVLVNLVALSLGPLTVALLTDHVFGRPQSVGYALACTDAVGALVAVAAILACRRGFTELRTA